MVDRLLVVVTLAVAVGLRVWGLDFGLPHFLTRPDEEAVIAIAGRCFRRQANPGFFDWPTLFMYATCAGHVAYFNVGRWLGWFPTEYSFLVAGVQNPGPLFLVARGLSAACGVATVWNVWRIGGLLCDRRTGTVAAALLAVAALHVRDSHFGVPDVAATWLVTQAFYWTLSGTRTADWRTFLRAAVWGGLATSVKYNAALILLPGLWVLLADGRMGRPGQRAWRAVRFGGLAVLVFLLGTPFAVLDWPAFVTGLANISAHLRDGHAAFEGRGWWVHVTTSLGLGLGWPMLVAGTVGLVAIAARDRRTGVLVILFPLAYYALVGSGRTTFARYILPVVPFLCLGAGWTVRVASRWAAARGPRAASEPLVACVLTVLVAAPSAYAAVRSNRLLARTDTRLLAAEWIRRAFPEGTTVAQTGSTYAQVQMATAGAQGSERYVALAFDEEARVFRAADRGVRDAAVVVRPRCPFVYCDASAGLDPVLARDYELAHTVVGIDPAGPPPRYDRDDAFFVPLARFDAVLRPGPTIEIWRRRAGPEGPAAD